jgi:hypothetical protein
MATFVGADESQGQQAERERAEDERLQCQAHPQ